MDIRVRGGRTHVGQPLRRIVGADRRLRAMIDHDRQRRKGAGDGGDAIDLMRPDERIEDEAICRQRVEPRTGRGAVDPRGIEHILQHRPHAHQLWPIGERGDPPQRMGRREVGPADDAADPVVPVGDVQQIGGLGLGRRRLHEDRRVDPGAVHQRAQIARAEVAIEMCIVGAEPAIVAPRGRPEMLMRVDPHHARSAAPVGSGASGRSNPASCSALHRLAGIGCR